MRRTQRNPVALVELAFFVPVSFAFLCVLSSCRFHDAPLLRRPETFPPLLLRRALLSPPNGVPRCTTLGCAAPSPRRPRAGFIVYPAPLLLRTRRTVPLSSFPSALHAFRSLFLSRPTCVDLLPFAHVASFSVFVLSRHLLLRSCSALFWSFSPLSSRSSLLFVCCTHYLFANVTVWWYE